MKALFIITVLMALFSLALSAPGQRVYFEEHNFPMQDRELIQTVDMHDEKALRQLFPKEGELRLHSNTALNFLPTNRFLSNLCDICYTVLCIYML